MSKLEGEADKNVEVRFNLVLACSSFYYWIFPVFFKMSNEFFLIQ